MGFSVMTCCLAGFDLPALTSPALTFTGLTLAGAGLVGATIVAKLAGLGLTVVLAGTMMALLARVG